MIIVEGPDGAGKTTLVAELEERLLIDREPRAVSSDAKALRPLGDYITEELAKGFGPRLYDRFALISSPMYASLPNSTFTGPMLDRIWLTEQMRKFYLVDPAIIICLPPYEVVKANVDKDEASEVMWNHLYHIYYGYHTWYCGELARYNTSVLLWDYTAPDHQRLTGLLNWAQARVKVGKKWKTD